MMKLYRKNDGREVVVGDVVKYRGRPHYIDSFCNELVFITSMCERRFFLSCRPEDIDCTEERVEPMVDYKF
jgi:hypothetical protein